MVLTPFVNAHWRRQSKRGSEPKPLTKMSIGCFMLSLGYGVLVLAELLASAHGPPTSDSGGVAPEDAAETGGGAVGGDDIDVHDKVSIIWVALSLAIATAGELYLSPVGLSFVSKVAPSYMTSLAVGCWMLASFGGNMLAGHLGTMYVLISTLSLSLSLSL